MSCITITFGDRAENHRGMQVIGTESEHGFTVEDLEEFKKKFESDGLICELIDLTMFVAPHIALKINEIEGTPGHPRGAKVLVVKNCISKLLEKSQLKPNANANANANANVNSNTDVDALFNELVNLNWDVRAFMYGRVVNKHARYNLCFGDVEQEPDYKVGKGRIISWNQVPHL